MAGSVAEAYVIGNVTRDAEVREAGATRVCNLTVVHNTKYKDKETTSYIEVVLFGKLADIAGQYVTKGSKVFVSGELREEKWDDKETGAKRSKLKIIGQRLTLLGSKGDRGGRGEPDHDSGHSEDYDPADSSGAPF